MSGAYNWLCLFDLVRRKTEIKHWLKSDELIKVKQTFKLNKAKGIIIKALQHSNSCCLYHLNYKNKENKT